MADLKKDPSFTIHTHVNPKLNDPTPRDLRESSWFCGSFGQRKSNEGFNVRPSIDNTNNPIGNTFGKPSFPGGHKFSITNALFTTMNNKS